MFTCSNPKFINLTSVPCNNCYNCQMRKRAEWDFRLLQESLHCKDAVFLTLTYDNEHLEPLNKHILQLYFKKLRNLGYKFTYYAVGEYGERTGRPHYHVLLFISSYPSGSVCNPFSLYGTWNLGMMDVGSFTPKSVHYVTKWHVHPKYDRDHPREAHGFHPSVQTARCFFFTSIKF